MLEELKKEVFEENLELVEKKLVIYTWGNVSGIDRESKIFAIKPSGVDYDKLTPDDMVLMDLNGNKVEGKYNPSSDTATHLIIFFWQEAVAIISFPSLNTTEWVICSS